MHGWPNQSRLNRNERKHSFFMKPKLHRTQNNLREKTRRAMVELLNQHLADASFDATWELDLFGRVRRSVQAANARVDSVEAIRLDVLVSVTAEVARNYFELRGYKAVYILNDAEIGLFSDDVVVNCVP